MKKPKGVKLWTKQNGKLVGEMWVPCRQFALHIRRPYRTVLTWFRKKWLPAIELGERHYITCICPWPRVMAGYLKLQKSGRLRAPRSKC